MPPSSVPFPKSQTQQKQRIMEDIFSKPDKLKEWPKDGPVVSPVGGVGDRVGGQRGEGREVDHPLT